MESRLQAVSVQKLLRAEFSTEFLRGSAGESAGLKGSAPEQETLLTKKCAAGEMDSRRHNPAPATITKLKRIRWIHPNWRKDPVFLLHKPLHLGLHVVLKIIKNCGVGVIRAEDWLLDCSAEVIPLLIAQDHFAHWGFVHLYYR
jgi:hypothetical protein